MPYVETIKTKAGTRHRGVYRVNGRRYSQVFDYEYQAETWATVEEAKARNTVAAMTAVSVALTGQAPTSPADPTREAPTLGAHAAEWINRRSGRLAAATVNNYRHHLRALKAEGLADRPMDAITRGDIDRWQTAASKAAKAAAKAAKKRGNGSSVLNQRLKFVRSVYLDAMAEYPGVVNHNPTHGVDFLPIGDAPDRVLSDAEVSALLLAAGDDAEVRLPILLGVDAGLRWSEVFGLTPRALVSDRFLIVHQVVERDSKSVREYPKGHRSRLVPMTPRLADALRAHAAEVEAAHGPDALLFPGPDGKARSYWVWTDTKYRKAKNAAGIKGAGFHTLRHTYGSRLAAKGVARVEIAKVMGHADEATTARYIHAGDDGRRYDLITGALG